MRVNKETIQLECTLTDAEKLVYGKELSQNLNKIQELDGQLQRFKDGIKSEMTTCETTVNVLSRKIDTGKEFRMIECAITRNWETKTRTWTRTDTGEVVKDDIIPEHEIQEELELNEGKVKTEQAEAVERATEESKAFSASAANIVHFEKGKKVKK